MERAVPPAWMPPPVVAAAPATAQTLEAAEIELIRSVLKAAGGNISAASKQLGISRNTIYRKLRRADGSDDGPAA